MIVGVGHVNRAMPVWNGMSRVADVAVEGAGSCSLRRFEGEFAVLVEVQLPCGSFLRRPGIELHPLVAARLKKQSFFKRKAALVLEPVSKPGRFDFLAKVERRIAAERNLAERISQAVSPAAVIPRARNQIIQVIGIVLL